MSDLPHSADTVGYLCTICGEFVWWRDVARRGHELLCSVCSAWADSLPHNSSSGAGS